MRGQIIVGTSGYAYDDWRGLFYPRALPSSRWLDWYSDFFSALELNATFYRLPSIESIRRWRDSTPSRFLFSVKGSRYLTHMKRLTDHERGLARFYHQISPLGDKLAVVLWQLPPQMNKPDAGRLDAFLKAQPAGPDLAVEFRNEAWYTREICDVLDRHQAAFCEHDLIDRRPPRLTGRLRYIRFHGSGARYGGRYGAARLKRMARELRRYRDGGGCGYVFFNNDRRGAALYDARDMAQQLGQPLPLELKRA